MRAYFGRWQDSAPRLSQNILTFGIGSVVGIESVGLLFLYGRIDNNSYCKPLEWRFYKIYIANRYTIDSNRLVEIAVFFQQLQE